MIRLIATDLDGTLLNACGRLPEGIFDIVRALKEKGIQFAVCSGRTYGNMRRLFAPVADEMAYVCENGAMCVVDDMVSDIVPIPDGEAKEIISDIQAEKMNLLISGRHTTYVLDENRRYTDDIVYRLRNTVTVVDDPAQVTEPILKISGQKNEGMGESAARLGAKWAGRVTATLASRDWFDFTCANKGIGMRSLLRRLNIAPAETAAFGDSFNDESMLDLVGYPFIMAKAAAQLKKPGYCLCDNEMDILRQIVQGTWKPLQGRD